MKKLFIPLILLSSFLFSACSDNKERIVTISVRGGNEFDSISRIDIIKSFEGEDVEIVNITAASKEGRYSVNELFVIDGAKLEFRVFPGDKHNFDGFTGDLKLDTRIGNLIVDGDKKVNIEFNFKSEILNEPNINGSTYEINHSSHIRWIADRVTNVNGDNFLNKTIKMTDDIYMDGIDFEGIAPSEENQNDIVFAGIFDGDGHTIHNVKITSDKSVVGFIGNLDMSGSIRNLSVEGIIYAQGSYVGGIVGRGPSSSAAYPTVENVYSKVDIHVYPTGTCYVGGIAGGNVSVQRSYNAGQIEINDFPTPATGAGIIGNNGKVDNCYNTGQILGYGNVYIAGIAGTATLGANTITGSYNVGSLIVLNKTVNTKIGGIVINNYTVSDSYFYQENGVNDGVTTIADNPGAGSTGINNLFFSIADKYFQNYDPTIWKMKSGLSTGNGDSNKVVDTRPVLIGLGEGK